MCAKDCTRKSTSGRSKQHYFYQLNILSLEKQMCVTMHCSLKCMKHGDSCNSSKRICQRTRLPHTLAHCNHVSSWYQLRSLTKTIHIQAHNTIGCWDLYDNDNNPLWDECHLYLLEKCHNLLLRE
jgi:hypothetical protein